MGISIKLCYRPSAIKGKDGTLYYQIIIKRTTHTYASGYLTPMNGKNNTADYLPTAAHSSKLRIVPIGRCNKYMPSPNDILTTERLWILDVLYLNLKN